MKKLATSIIIVLGLGLASLNTFAYEVKQTNKSEALASENPWEIFKEVVHTYKTSNVDFMYTSEADQAAFLEAAGAMKEKISENPDFRVEEKIKRIDQAVAVFKYLWAIKSNILIDTNSPEIIEIPEII